MFLFPKIWWNRMFLARFRYNLYPSPVGDWDLAPGTITTGTSCPNHTWDTICMHYLVITTHILPYLHFRCVIWSHSYCVMLLQMANFPTNAWDTIYALQYNIYDIHNIYNMCIQHLILLTYDVKVSSSRFIDCQCSFLWTFFRNMWSGGGPNVPSGGLLWLTKF